MEHDTLRVLIASAKDLQWRWSLAHLEAMRLGWFQRSTFVSRPLKDAQLASKIGDLEHIAVRETDTGLPLVGPILKLRWRAEKAPVCNCLLRKVYVRRAAVDAMEILGIDLTCCDQEAARLLQDPPHWIRVKSAILLGAVQIQAQAGTKTDGADDGVVGRAVLVRHDACARCVLIYQNMVGASMWARGKNVGLVVGRRNREQTGDDGLLQPVWERSRVEECILDEVGGPRLKSTVRQLSPSSLGGRLNLG